VYTIDARFVMRSGVFVTDLPYRAQHRTFILEIMDLDGDASMIQETEVCPYYGGKMELGFVVSP